ncbi:hypothetical protein JTB14_031313 [Gonioctena quinquepunctata]|nr:hypothetical protein JTB14_031313 [Gonioctena quinquepunctata]
MFDETTDIPHVSQMSLAIRYLQGSEVKEDSLGFIDYHTEKYELNPNTMEPVLTRRILRQIVVSQGKKLNLPFMDCVGICTDGCSGITSKQNGAVQEAQKMLISAVRCPCLSHALNLSLSKSFSAQSVRNAWEERDSLSKAQNYASALKDSSFVVSLFCMSEVFSVTMPHSKLLQKKNLVLGAANDAVLSTLVVLKENRQDAEKYFNAIFMNIGKSLDELGVTLSKPRTTGIMRHRPNLSCESLEQN